MDTHYYNVVHNASGTFTLEEVPRICTADGQRIQFVVEDVSDSSNGSQRLVTYTTAPQNRQAILTPQTINLGNQISTTRLEQGQNVYIIKTNDISGTQEILKQEVLNTVNAHIVNENIVSIASNTGIKTECKNEGQSVQFMKIQNANTSTVAKQNALLEKNQTAILTKSNIQNNITPPFYVNSESYNPCQMEKKLNVKACQIKNRQLTNNIVGIIPQTPGIKVVTTMENRIQNSNTIGPKSTLSVCKTIGSQRQVVAVRPVRTPNSNISHVRPVAIVPPEISKTPTRMQPPDMEHLNEQIKQAKIKQLKLQIEKQRFLQNNTQQLSHTLQHIHSSSHNPTRHFISSTQQRTQQISISTQQPKPSVVMSVSSSAEHNTAITNTDMEVNSSELVQEKGHSTQQSSSPRLEHESSSSESVAYLKNTINDPANAIVQQQIQGNTAKMLVMLATGEQRLITFDIPNEDCTVHDLLDQVNIPFPNETQVSLVDDPALGINYIVEPRDSGMLSTSFEGTDGDCNSTQEIVSSTANIENLSQSTNASDENSNTSQTIEEPILVKGMLALCPHCGYSSLFFNRCERCNTKIKIDGVKSIPIAERKEAGMSVDMFYKKNNERNATKSEKIERDGPKRSKGKAKGTASKPKPIHKEPECLTISSDEEEEGRPKKTGSINNNAVVGNASNTFNEDMDTIVDKEPIITNTSVFNLYDDVINNEENSKEINENQNFLDIAQTALECRTVRIGSYKYIPREKVVISYSGVRFSVPLLEDDASFVTLDVKYKDIVKLLIHFGKTMPVLFFYTSVNTGAMIRELLGMQDPKGPYYDPAGKDHTHKRITLLPDKLPEDSKVILTNLFSRGHKIDELSPKEANDILIRASPRCLQSHNTTRKQSQNVANTTAVSDDIQTITVYPPPPAKGGIAINTEDYLCLAEDQFLNDVIIDFYLKYLTLEVLSESDQHRTHVFSSYFYKRLTSPHAQAAESIVPMTPAAKRHARVQKWTKNVNIFEKDFVIIPINEHAHWFLAIICFPGLVGKVSTCTAKTNENYVNKTAQKSKKIKELKAKAVTIGSTTITPVPTTITIDQLDDDGSERDEAEGDDDEMEMDSDEEDEIDQSEEDKIQINIKLEEQKETIRNPCILIFDSLAGASRSRVVATLRDYLSCEHVAKLGVEKTFSKDTIKGACPKIPQQSNFTDCGLYDPVKDYTLPIKTLKTWFEEIVVTRKREELSNLLIKLMNIKGGKTINLPTVNFPTKSESENNKRKSTSDADTRMVTFVTENNESTNEVVGRTYQIIPYSLSSNSSESNSSDILTEQKMTRSSAETMSYLKSKRIHRIVSRTQNQDDSPSTAKKHKGGESLNSCK
ncbi:Sentrin-specific protease 7 [Trachymyrmex zeteki]|uniref:Sentrin-specific protease 7 n=1 Tax=Mycetomoellerius zeteki TaxID=64791 RepID=A0A151X6A1_9HYME|nr:Sentrin-specific protease 7 [Trachymyrmex zeteki]